MRQFFGFGPGSSPTWSNLWPKYYRPGRIVENLILERGEIAYWKINCADARMLAVASFIALDQVHLGGILATSELAVGLIRSSPLFPFVRSTPLCSLFCGLPDPW